MIFLAGPAGRGGVLIFPAGSAGWGGVLIFFAGPARPGLAGGGVLIFSRGRAQSSAVGGFPSNLVISLGKHKGKIRRSQACWRPAGELTLGGVLIFFAGPAGRGGGILFFAGRGEISCAQEIWRLSRRNFLRAGNFEPYEK